MRSRIRILLHLFNQLSNSTLLLLLTSGIISFTSFSRPFSQSLILDMLSDKLYCMVIEVEKEMYETANSALEYYQLLPTTNYLLKFDFQH